MAEGYHPACTSKARKVGDAAMQRSSKTLAGARGEAPLDLFGKRFFEQSMEALSGFPSTGISVFGMQIRLMT